jgi:hypothetical protein
MDAANKHATALARAEDQMARGEPVQVADVAPVPDAPFKAWFEGSKVVDAEGKPLRVYHGTGVDVAEFRIGEATNAQAFGKGIYFTDNADYADSFAYGEQPNIVPAYVSLKNPLIVETRTPEFAKAFPAGESPEQTTAQIQAAGHDGIIIRSEGRKRGQYSQEIVAFDPAQVKSAIGNTRFDPTSGSLTDSPYATWTEQVNAAIREMRAAAEEARPKRAPAVEIDPKGGTPEQFARFAEATKATEPADVTAAAAPARLDAIRAQYPDLMVQMDGGAPMRMDDFLAAAKAEADELAADAPLMAAAAECAATFGL